MLERKEPLGYGALSAPVHGPVDEDEQIPVGVGGRISTGARAVKNHLRPRLNRADRPKRLFGNGINGRFHTDFSGAQAPGVL
jgi:hypothetical protein